MKHIAPRNPHPRRRVRHKQCARVVRNAHKVFQRELDAHDRYEVALREHGYDYDTSRPSYRYRAEDF